MKILLLDDLHLEFRYWEPNPDTVESADVVILAGDIATGEEGYIYAEDLAITYPNQQFIYILGNHEFYHQEYHWLINQLHNRCKQNETPNFHYLDDSHIIINDVVFYGGTCWTDLTQFDEKSVQAMKNGMNDFRLIGGLTENIWQEAHDEFIMGLTNMKYQQDDRKLVVISHHLPSIQSVHPRWQKEPYNQLNSGFYSNLEKYMENVTLWCHGHTHENFDYMIGGTRVFCQPRGYYPHEKQSHTYNPQVIEI